jgi:hypothetical protein
MRHYTAIAIGGRPECECAFPTLLAKSTDVRKDANMSLAPGITKAGDGLDNIAWNILGQIYVPKAVSEGSFAWHATLPPDTFVPPHIHPTQMSSSTCSRASSS